MRKILMLTAAVLAFQALPALAEDGGPKGGEKHGNRMFEEQDTNKDGAISEDEFVAFSKKRFVETDANKDGKVTQDEAKAHHDAMKAKWKEKRAEMKAKGDAPKEEPKPE